MREMPENEDDNEEPCVIALADDFLDSLMENQDELESLGFVVWPDEIMETYGESIPAGDSPAVGEVGWPKPVSHNPNALANVLYSSEGTGGSGGDGSSIFSDQQSKASGEDAEEDEKPGDDVSPM